MTPTSGCAADYHTAYAFVYPMQSAGPRKALRGLQAGLDGVYGKEEQVDRCACESASLTWSTNACTRERGADIPQGTARMLVPLP